MKSAIIKRSVTIDAHRTGVSLEDDFWNMLKEIADQRGTSVKELIASIKAERRVGTLSTALRLFVLAHLQDQITAFLRQGDQSDATPVMNRRAAS